MKKFTSIVAVLALVTFVAGCAREQEEAPVVAEVSEGPIMMMPVTTSSDEAMQHFKDGQQALDVGRPFDAKGHFDKAIEVDPNFAYACLLAGFTSTSADEFIGYVKMADERSGDVSEAEKLQIQIAKSFLNNDAEGGLGLATQLIQIEPESPRALMTLAFAQGNLNKIEEQRATIRKAIELTPNFVPAYTQLGNSYLFTEPKDFAKAEESFSRVAELEPDEQNSHDLLGDVYRAQNDLMKARDSYTRAAELAPSDASPLQQRGHVNSFLGAYDEARADYTAAIERGRGNEPAYYVQWRAYVSVYAGDPKAAIDELNELVTAIDGMDIPGPLGAKIAALTDVATIALHHGMFDVAEEALERRSELVAEQIDQVGTEDFRRTQEANIAYWQGQLAARKGDYSTAIQKAQEFMTTVDPIQNPRKNEQAHELLGLVSLLQDNYSGAIEHYAQADPNDIYMQYHLALAHDGAGNSAEAMEIFEDLAVYNFNFVGYALIRADVIERAA